MATKKKPGRPKSAPTKVIGIPVDKLKKVEKILGRKLAENQTPIVKVRVALDEVEKVRKAMK